MNLPEICKAFSLFTPLPKRHIQSLAGVESFLKAHFGQAFEKRISRTITDPRGMTLGVEWEFPTDENEHFLLSSFPSNDGHRSLIFSQVSHGHSQVIWYNHS